MRAYRKVDEAYEFRIDSGRLVLLGSGAGLVLLLVFLLGVLVGRGLWGGRTGPDLAAAPEEPAGAVEEIDPTPRREPPKYTFYDNLKADSPPAAAPQEPPAEPPPEAVPEPAAAPPPRADSPAESRVEPPAPEPAAAASQSSPPEPVAAPVEKPVPPPPRAQRTSLPAPVFTVQVGSFREEAAARSLAGKVQASGADAGVVRAAVEGRSWFRVQVGRFETRTQAEAFYRNHLKAKGIQGFVTTR